MNAYDFDGTIYNGDSTIDFFLFSLKQKPSLLRCVPKQILGFILYSLKCIDKTKLKEYFFCFLPYIDGPKLITDFWKQNHNKIYNWYLKQQQADDIIISASPEFLLQPICQKLGIQHLIASEVDIHSGKFFSKNCYGEEKVQRFIKEYPTTQIHQFYSDSYSDLPLAQIANQAFLIKNGTVTIWK